MNKKILIAEDSSVIQNLARKIFQQLEYSITSVKNGQEVIEKISSDNYDVILMDLNMPLMNGMESSKKIREIQDPSKSQIPIIAITGNAKNYSPQEFKDAGINEYLQKPLNFDLLVETVRKYTS